MADIYGTRFHDDDSFNGEFPDIWWRHKLRGTSGDDRIYGYAGNDVLEGYEGSDRLYGGSGNDRQYGGSGSDNLYGDAGDDLLRGDWDNDFLIGGTGNDSLYGGDENDYLNGGSGNDRIYGNNGNDTLWGGTGNDVLEGGANNDRLIGFGFGTAEYDDLRGGVSTRTTQTSGSDVFVLGMSYNQVFYTGTGFATIYDFGYLDFGYLDKIQLAGSQSDYALVNLHHGGNPGTLDIVIRLAAIPDYIGVILDRSLFSFGADNFTFV